MYLEEVISEFENRRHRELVELRKVLCTVFEELGYTLSIPDIGAYCLKTTLSSDFDMRISPEKNGVINIETWDLQFPPDQGYTPPGGYTVMPWISGNDIDLKDPHSIEELKQYIQDPVKYLGLERDCCFADRSSPFHNDADYNSEDCYHD